MKTWFDLVRDRLRLDWLESSSQAVPFSVTGVDAAGWRPGRLERISEPHWRLDAHHANGLRVAWDVRFFEETRALECWGTITHDGQAPVRGVRECLGLDLLLPARQELGKPWVRTFNGVRIIPNTFPPHDFACADRQLVDTPQSGWPLLLSGGEDGRSSAESLPCAIVCDERQEHGVALFLEWSGLWRMTVNKRPAVPGRDPHGRCLHLAAGLRGLRLHLPPGGSLPLPRVLFTAFDGDLESGGNSLRRHVRRNVTPALGGQEPQPPTSFNHWFAFDNRFTADTLKPAVAASAAAGLEYFCVDGGWFSGDFRSGIGNWEEGDPRKFPEGIRPFADHVRASGMRYGTWFEPEWAHRDSALHRAHPEWSLPTPESSPYQSAANAAFLDPEYLLIDFGLREVRQWWVERISRAYDEWGMRWIRWDFNQIPRPNWELGEPEGSVGWRQVGHVSGLYETLDQIMKACPELFIEQCASGGNRIDLGTARRGHSFWMSDHTTHSDIVRALQHGLNVVLPGVYANTNLCQDRHDYTDYDFLSHGSGGFGYSGRLWEAPPQDFERYRAAVARFKRYRHLLLGDYHRPTGQPRRADELARVVFTDGRGSVAMEFNPPGHPREARCTIA